MSAGAVDIATLGLEIRSDGVVVATDRLRKLEQEGGAAERSTKKLADGFESLTAYIKAAAVALGLFKLWDMAKDAALLSARYDTLGIVMGVVGNNAGYTSAQMKELERDLQKQGIAAVEARQTLTQMAQAHIDLSKSAQLARIAQDAAVIGQTNSSEAFERMISGIQRGEVEILKTIGINVNFEATYKKLAQQLGKNVDQLTENEKVQARVNSVMEKGKDIAGVYEAAMGTAGKQLSSMQRYMDNLKVSLGSVFNDLLIVGVSRFTDGLKEANTEADKLREEGKLKEWSRDLVLSFAAVADIVRTVINLMGTFTGTTIAGLMQIYKIGEASWNLVKGDFSGAKGSIKDMMAYGESWQEDMKNKWGGKSFYSTAQDMFSKRDSSAAADAEKLAALEKQRMAAGEASRQQAAEAEKQLAQQKALKDSIKDTSDEFKRMFEVWENEPPQHGELATQLLLWEDTTKAINTLTGQARLDEFNQQLKDMEGWAEAFPEKADIAAGAVKLLTEQFNAPDAAKLKEYMDSVRALEDDLNLVAGADKELIELERKIREGRLLLEITTKSLDEAQIKGNQGHIAALTRILELQKASVSRLEDQKRLMEEVAVLSGKIVGFDNGSPIYANQGGAFNNGQVMPTYTSPTSLLGTGAATGKNYWGEDIDKSGNVINRFGLPSFSGFAVGTPFVQKTGFALVHEGERITPESQNSGGSFGPVSITITGVDKNADQLAREIVPAMQKYMKRMAG